MASPTITLNELDAQYSNNTAVTVFATVTSNATITQVEFFLNGVSISIDTSGSSTATAAFSTSTLLCGTHTISATVTDSTSATATTSTSFEVVLYLQTDIPSGVYDWCLPEDDGHVKYTSGVGELNILPGDLDFFPGEIQICPDISYEIVLAGTGTEAQFYPPVQGGFYAVSGVIDTQGFYMVLEEVC